MLSLRNHFGIPGVISVIALVFAMLGGAYAASNDNGGGKATASAKGKRGPKGPKGATGPAGPQGPAGPAGPKGDTGIAGKDGVNGINGTNGISPAGTAFAGAKAGSGCSEGGVEFKGTNTTYACNGVQGTTGFTEFLPSEETETGVWGNAFEIPGPGFSDYPISFPIPLENIPTAVIVKSNEASQTGCPGRGPGGTLPEADPGFLCVYVMVEEGINAISARRYEEEEGFPGVWTQALGPAPYGSILVGHCNAPACTLGGTWAVSAS